MVVVMVICWWLQEECHRWCKPFWSYSNRACLPITSLLGALVLLNQPPPIWVNVCNIREYKGAAWSRHYRIQMLKKSSVWWWWYLQEEWLRWWKVFGSYSDRACLPIPSLLGALVLVHPSPLIGWIYALLTNLKAPYGQYITGFLLNELFLWGYHPCKCCHQIYRWFRFW